MKQLQEAFDTMLPTEEQKERMLCEILIARDGAPARKRRRNNPVRVAALLAAALALTIVTASAAEALGVSQMIRDYFQQKEEVSIMDQFNVAASGLSTTADNGWKITMTDLFGDENNCYVGVTLEAPEGTVLNRDDYCFYMYTLADGRTLNQMPAEDGTLREYHGLRDIGDTWFEHTQIPDSDPNDNRISFVFQQELDNYVDGAVTNFFFEELSYTEYQYNDAGERIGRTKHVIVEDFKAKIANVATHFASNSLQLASGQTIRAFGGETTLSKVTVSPLSISYKLSGGSVNDLYFGDFFMSEQSAKMTPEEKSAYLNSFQPTRPERFVSENQPNPDAIKWSWQNYWYCDVPVVLHYKDGTTQELDFKEYGHTTNEALDEGRLSIALTFDKLLDLDTLDYITVCDVRIELPAEP